MSDADALMEVAPPGEHLEHVTLKTFAPWHKPRKQWVRQEQWRKEIGHLIEKIRPQLDDRPLKYFSLPGLDLLDVRVVHDVCDEYGVGLQFLGFCADPDAEQTEQNISLHEVMNLPRVNPRSRFVPDNFTSIAKPSSVGYRTFKSFGSFDVVNLDLCDSVASSHRRYSSRRAYSKYFEALNALVARQTRNRVSRWVFFLTSRCNPSAVSADVTAVWQKCVSQNAKGDAVFAQGVEALQALEPRDPVLFTLGLSKWLARWLSSGTPPWKTTLRPCAQYSVESPGDMASLGFRFDAVRVSPSDPTGLAGESGQGEIDLDNVEIQCARQFLHQLSTFIDIDQRLRNEPDTHEEMIRQSMELLHLARYPVETDRSHFGL